MLDAAPDSTPAGGRLFWLTGLAGAGKSTVGRELAALLRREKSAVILLDGDELRAVMSVAGNPDSAAPYSPASRADLAMRYSRLCAMLTRQGHDVICATSSWTFTARPAGFAPPAFR